MPLFDAIALAVAIGAVTFSASSLYALLRNDNSQRGRKSQRPSQPDEALQSAETTAAGDTNANGAAAATVSWPRTLVTRYKPVLVGACRVGYRAVRTFLPTFTTIGAAWLLLHNPTPFLTAFPAWFSSYGARVLDVVPLHPNNVLESFDYGVAWQLLQGGHVSAALEQAAATAGRLVSAEELNAARTLIEELAAKRGLAERVWSSFTIVNAVWLVAACGLVSVAVPFLVVIFRPVLVRIPWKKVMDALIRLATRCVPLIEPALYLSAFGLAVESARYVGTDTMAGPVLSVTSALIFVAAIARSLTVAAARWGSHGAKRSALTASGILTAAFVAPLAVLHQSTLLGYVVMGAFSAAIGLMADAYPWGAFIGFRRHSDLISTAIGCGSLTWLQLLLTASGVQPAALAPFQSAVGVIGTTGYLLALDIQALLNRNAISYALYGGNMLAYFVAGELLGLEGMSNVAKTFSGIGLFTLYCGHYPTHGRSDRKTVWLFFLFGGLYSGCMYLNRNPHLVAALFGGSPFLNTSTDVS